MAAAVVLFVMLSIVVVHGTETLTIKLINSTRIGSSKGAPHCPCKLKITISLTDSHSCQCQLSSGGCTQCNVIVNTTTDLKLDTGNGATCNMNNLFHGQTKLHLGVNVSETENVSLFLRPILIGTFCQLISLDKGQSSYNISDGGDSSLLIEVTSNLFTTTPKTVTAKNIHPGAPSTGIKPPSLGSNETTTETNGDDNSLSTGAIAGIVVGVIALLVILVIVAFTMKKYYQS